MSARLKLISLSVIVFSALVLLWVTRSQSKSVSARVIKVTVGHPSENYGIATIVLSNPSRRSISYVGNGGRAPLHALLYDTPTGWKDTNRLWICGTGLTDETLKPSQSITFDALIERNKPCKVAVNYTYQPPLNRLWQLLPAWISQRLPIDRTSKTASTDPIDLAHAGGLTVERYDPCLGRPQDVAALQAAARKGNADAQFKLAGGYLTGTAFERNVDEALRWFEAAATNGHAQAAYKLATIYDYGLDTPANEAKAAQWYRIASERGNIAAKNRIWAQARESEKDQSR